MGYDTLRTELKAFYWDHESSLEKSRAFAEKCFQILEGKVTEGMSVPQQKMLQYQVIVDECKVQLFENSPFYFETGVLSAHSDGARYAKNGSHIQANGWVFMRNEHLFKDQDPKLWARRCAQAGEQLYLICGPYNDTSQHFNFLNRPILEEGLKGIYETAAAAKADCHDPEEQEFLDSVCHGMLQLKRLAEKYAEKAKELWDVEQDPKKAENWKKIADTASRIPWEAPGTFYEALCTLAFLRTAVGSLEGVGPNTFGRLDLDLYPFYQNDVEKGILTGEKAYDLICHFLLIWDLHYDHDMKMVSYADHELENTYTLGGCDRQGKVVYNELTKLFLQATREEKIIFPKIKCRFSKESPKEYLDEINNAVIKGMSTVLYQNDDTSIPALVQSGKTIEEARDYFVSGCWGLSIHEEKYDHGSYVNLLKPFEYALYDMQDKMKQVGITFESYKQADSFEEIYLITVENCKRLLEERIRITREGGQIWHKVDVLPIFSATLPGCLEKRKDFTKAGGKYQDDYLLMFGLPNIVDSLMAMKNLIYDTKKCTLSKMLEAIGHNWQGFEQLRADAIACPGWGDGSEEAAALAARLHRDLYQIAAKIPGTYGGKVNIGHITYTEIRWWAQNIKATPDGRHDGEYFSQGLTPSRLKKIASVTDVITSMKALDASTMASNNVINIILPSNRMTLEICEAFLRTLADSAVMCLQLNCVTKEQLLDAQKHPEEYPDLIVRVCGFSARFTSLSPEWQKEVLSRNFYD